MKFFGRLPGVFLAAALVFWSLSPLACAQEIFFNWKPFQLQEELIPRMNYVLPRENSRVKPATLLDDRVELYSFSETMPFQTKGDIDRVRDSRWSLYGRGAFSLSLSTLRNKIPERHIGPASNEINRWELMRSLTTNFLDMPSRERFQYFGDIFEPELKLGIEF